MVVKNYRSKYHYLRSFSSYLNYYVLHQHHPNCTTASWKDRLVTTVATTTKAIAFKLLLHYSTIIQLTFWFCFLTSLSLVDIYHGDLIFLAKRLGRVSANCLPTILFLTLRPSPLPNTLYLTLIPIHKWLSRLIIVQAVIHTLIYLAFFNRNGTWAKAIKWENIYGWAALSAFLIIIATSLSKFRVKWYKVFYFLHYSCTWVIVFSLQIHIRPQPFTFYTIANCLILMGQIGYRVYLTKVSQKDEVRVIDISPNLALVEYPNSLIKKPATAPGAHVRLTDYSSSFIIRAFKQIIPNYHPYTLVSLPQDRVQKLLIRKSNFRLYNGHRYLITGTYDPHLLFVNYKQTKSNKKFSLAKLHVDAKRILIVVGGSAISFALPILRVMNYHGIPTKVVWVIKDFRDVLVLKYFDGIIHGDDLEIFITGNQLLQDGQQQQLKNAYSYASNLSRRSVAPSAHYDLENEESPLLGGTENEQIVTLNRENQDEDVEIIVNSDDDEEEEEDEGNCTRHDSNSLCRESSPEQFADLDEVLSDVNSVAENDNLDEFEVTNTTINTRRSSFRSSLNEPFVPIPDYNSTDQVRSWISEYKETTRRLNIDKKIYKGRPKLNHRYYNWCINEGFTQCSGPVEDENHNLICCRDLPQNKVVQEDINAEKIWVIGAGPRQLVENVKLWSSENGLKFHEEAFYS
ncbi:FRE8 [Candida metapsilosis]|uniref:FRE8 n=1 Tax=Candida metapsilosis TaxID=273372 RepID=A0A8H8DDD1_9ASCO|nr:FRE8 [Candida metapsilosis]